MALRSAQGVGRIGPALFANAGSCLFQCHGQRPVQTARFNAQAIAHRSRHPAAVIDAAIKTGGTSRAAIGITGITGIKAGASPRVTRRCAQHRHRQCRAQLPHAEKPTLLPEIYLHLRPIVLSQSCIRI